MGAVEMDMPRTKGGTTGKVDSSGSWHPKPNKHCLGPLGFIGVSEASYFV